MLYTVINKEIAYMKVKVPAVAVPAYHVEYYRTGKGPVLS